MALADNFRSNLSKSRGIDPNAARTLQSRTDSRKKREDDLKRKQIEREINALRARLTVIEREIQRLSVSERRFHADESRAQEEFDSEVKNISELTKELGRHSDKVAEIKRLLSTKKVSLGRTSGHSDFGREAAQKETERLKNDLKRVDREIDQLNSQRRRLISEMAGFQQKAKQASEMEMKESSEERRDESEIAKILDQLQSEESILSRFKSRFSVEQKNVLQKQHELENVQKRMHGANSGAPALESEKQRIESKISELERNLNQYE